MPDFDEDLDVIDRVDVDREERVSKPKRYNVVLHNDDFSHPVAVVMILVDIFKKSAPEAVKLMEQAHIEGKSICGTYCKDAAETKQSDAMNKSKEMEQALLFTVEPVDD